MTQSSSWLRASWKRWLSWLVLATIFAIACVFLSNWQFNRRAEAVARITLITNNYDQKPVPLAEVQTPTGFHPKDEWRPVSVTGEYITDEVFLVRNRPNNGQPGFEQLAAFRASDGQVLAIDRGWLPTGDKQDSPDFVPGLPSGKLTLVGRIRPTEPDINRDAPAGQLPTINAKLMQAKMTTNASVVDGFYLRMVTESVKVDRYPAKLSKPALDEGNHLSYALQWILFALMGFFALGWAIRQERIARRIANGPTFVPKQRKKVGDDDKNFEDAI